MQKLFSIELATASTVTFLRSNSMLFLMAIFFLIYITPATGLQISKGVMKAFSEMFATLIEFGYIQKSTVPSIALTMGFFLALVIESSGLIFAIRGQHVIGLVFSGASSGAALVNLLHTFHYSDANALVDICFSLFITCAPVAIVFLIGRELAKAIVIGENTITTYSNASSVIITDGLKKQLSKFKLK